LYLLASNSNMVCEIVGVEENLYVCKARSVLCYLKDARMTCGHGIVQVQYEVKSCRKTTSRVICAEGGWIVTYGAMYEGVYNG